MVPLDLSETSLQALDTAVELAAMNHATIDLLYINETLSGFSEHMPDNGNDHAKNVLNALTASVNHALDPEAVLLERSGNAIEGIISAISAQSPDLVVMGTHGTAGYRKGFIGSTTYGVMKYASCPVLSVPSGRKIRAFKKAVFPVRPVTGALRRFDVLSCLLSNEAVVDVLGLAYRKLEKTTNLLDRLVDEINPDHRQGVKVATVWGGNLSIAEEVLNFSQQAIPDLIMATPVLDVVDKPGFIGPHMQKILNCAHVPVLSVKNVQVPGLR